MTQCAHIALLEEKEHQQSCRRVNLDLTGWGDKIINNVGAAIGSRWVALELQKQQ